MSWVEDSWCIVLTYSLERPIGWGCRIHRLFLCRGVRLPRTSVLDMTLNHLRVMLYSPDTTRQIYRYVKCSYTSESRNTDDSLGSGTKRLLTFFFTFSFFDTRKERHNFYYADCSIWPNITRRWVLRPSSGDFRTREPTLNFEQYPSFNPCVSLAMILLTTTRYKC